MLERSLAARSATAVFYEMFNDIDIYIEDTAIGYEKIFTKLLGRALDGQVVIDKVFPLGNRGQVVEEAKRRLQSPSSRKSIFIVDGDLYLLCGEIGDLPANVITLPRYCIENFLSDKNALHQILDEEDPLKPIKELTETFSYDAWLTQINESLRPLFLIFSAAHFLQSGIRTVSLGIQGICADQFGNINTEKAEKLYNEIHSQLSERYGVVKIEYLLSKFSNRVSPNICFGSTYVSGKDFLLPLIFLRIRTISKSKSTNINLKIRLADRCSIAPLAEVAKKIFSEFRLKE